VEQEGYGRFGSRWKWKGEKPWPNLAVVLVVMVVAEVPVLWPP
jgi:hypothetical protein